MRKLIQILAFLVLSSCTISISQVHTEGQASDVIDENQKADADVSPTFSLPGLTKKPGPKDTGWI
jgi:hypothetical protein